MPPSEIQVDIRQNFRYTTERERKFDNLPNWGLPRLIGHVSAFLIASTIVTNVVFFVPVFYSIPATWSSSWTYILISFPLCAAIVGSNASFTFLYLTDLPNSASTVLLSGFLNAATCGVCSAVAFLIGVFPIPFSLAVLGPTVVINVVLSAYLTTSSTDWKDPLIRAQVKIVALHLFTALHFFFAYVLYYVGFNFLPNNDALRAFYTLLLPVLKWSWMKVDHKIFSTIDPNTGAFSHFNPMYMHVVFVGATVSRTDSWLICIIIVSYDIIGNVILVSKLNSKVQERKVFLSSRMKEAKNKVKEKINSRRSNKSSGNSDGSNQSRSAGTEDVVGELPAVGLTPVVPTVPGATPQNPQKRNLRRHWTVTINQHQWRQRQLFICEKYALEELCELIAPLHSLMFILWANNGWNRKVLLAFGTDPPTEDQTFQASMALLSIVVAESIVFFVSRALMMRHNLRIDLLNMLVFLVREHWLVLLTNSAAWFSVVQFATTMRLAGFDFTFEFEWLSG